jgi:hypothetical protein
MDVDMMAEMPPVDASLAGPEGMAPPGDPGGMGDMDALGAEFGEQGVEHMAAPDLMGTAPPPGMEGDPTENRAPPEPTGTNPPPGAEGEPTAGRDEAPGGAKDQARDQGAGERAPEKGEPPDAAEEAPADTPDTAPEPAAGPDEPRAREKGKKTNERARAALRLAKGTQETPQTKKERANRCGRTERTPLPPPTPPPPPLRSSPTYIRPSYLSNSISVS